MTENPQSLSREVQVATMLANIHRRLTGSKAVRDLSGTPQITPSENLLNLFFYADTTKIARSEFSITLEQLGLFNTKIEEARKVLFEKGQTGTELWLEGGPLASYEGFTEEEMMNYYQYHNLDTSIIASGYKENKPVYESDEGCARLMFFVNESNLGIQLALNLEGYYSLEIAFSKPDHFDYKEEYHSGTKPLDQMTPEEYEITTFYLDRYITEATTGKFLGKQGLPLRSLDGFPSAYVEKLKPLSVTTAEELLGLYMVPGKLLATYLGMTEDELKQLKDKVASLLPDDLVQQLQTPVTEDFPLGSLPPDYSE